MHALHVCRLKDADLFCIWDEPEDWTFLKEHDELQDSGKHHWTTDRYMFSRNMSKADGGPMPILEYAEFLNNR